jgi:hypothetical protein
MNYKIKYNKYKQKFNQLGGASKLLLNTEQMSYIIGNNVSNNPNFQKIITPEILELGKKFQKYRFELRIVGGAVRDLLSNNEINDIDFSTTATPSQMI